MFWVFDPAATVPSVSSTQIQHTGREPRVRAEGRLRGGALPQGVHTAFDCVYLCTPTERHPLETQRPNPDHHRPHPQINRLAAFALGEYAAAHAAFERGLALRGGVDADARKYGAWLRKCRLELEEAATAAAGAGKDCGSGADGSSSTMPVPAPVAPAVPAVAVPTGPAKYQYYQSGTHVTVTLLQKGVAEESADVRIEPRRVRLVWWGFVGGGCRDGWSAGWLTDGWPLCVHDTRVMPPTDS